ERIKEWKAEKAADRELAKITAERETQKELELAKITADQELARLTHALEMEK
ncbi:hypothetical protein ACJMK2_037825, partial [Sinanodonta woodiana]